MQQLQRLGAGGWPYANELRQAYDGNRRMLGVLPVDTHPASDDGKRWLTFYYSLSGVRVDRFDAAALAQLQRDVARLWPELAQRTQSLVEPGARCRDVVLRRPWRDRTVFIGDAAHGISPQLGQGVNMALLDAQALANELRAHADVEVWHRLDARVRLLAIYQTLSRWLTPLFQSDSRVLASLRRYIFRPARAASLRKAADAEDPRRHQTTVVALSDGLPRWLV